MDFGAETEKELIEVLNDEKLLEEANDIMPIAKRKYLQQFRKQFLDSAEPNEKDDKSRSSHVTEV